jgi:hypothetical protein
VVRRVGTEGKEANKILLAAMARQRHDPPGRGLLYVRPLAMGDRCREGRGGICAEITSVKVALKTKIVMDTKLFYAR